ncbi:hypothetical protein [Streptomyces sp. F001]|nr:hypothetical protein [Streptomyces sp. F001]
MEAPEAGFEADGRSGSLLELRPDDTFEESVEYAHQYAEAG